MKAVPAAGMMIVRVTAAFSLAAAILYSFPQTFYSLTIPFVNAFSDWSCPYLSGVSMSVDGQIISIKGVLTLSMTLEDGSVIPPAAATWHLDSRHLLNIFAVAIAVWAGPHSSAMTRLTALPVAIMLSVLVCSYLLAVEIQETALSYVGEEWLISLPVAQTDGNMDYFETMKTRFVMIKWLQSVHEGGGALFLGVISGFLGYAIPAVKKTRSPDPQL